MSDKQELQVREKKELKEEATREGPHFTPDVDIYETEQALVVLADVPGSTSEAIELDLRDSQLSLSARVQPLDKRWKPIYLEYEVGDYSRLFRLGQMFDEAKISAQVKDGVLLVRVPKAQKALPRKIQVSME
jgi:HSP20 family protein